MLLFWHAQWVSVMLLVARFGSMDLVLKPDPIIAILLRRGQANSGNQG